MTTNNHEVNNYIIASKTKRLCGFFIDLLFQVIIIYSFQLIIFKTSFEEFLNKEIDLYSVCINGIIAFIFGAITYPFFIGNIGHKITGLKVIDQKTGKEFKNFIDGGFRELLKNLLSYLIFPVIWLLFDKKKQNLYDKITNTYVVEK
tara:strand:+ start:2164 stop:2604 length:441 start_codon:yes stop_codon:yes gene_type:complete